eukprot:349801-Chlamydomonas_euryale.AAC.55
MRGGGGSGVPCGSGTSGCKLPGEQAACGGAGDGGGAANDCGDFPTPTSTPSPASCSSCWSLAEQLSGSVAAASPSARGPRAVTATAASACETAAPSASRLPTRPPHVAEASADAQLMPIQ